jgi:hypothetical protein
METAFGKFFHYFDSISFQNLLRPVGEFRRERDRDELNNISLSLSLSLEPTLEESSTTPSIQKQGDQPVDKLAPEKRHYTAPPNRFVGSSAKLAS